MFVTEIPRRCLLIKMICVLIFSLKVYRCYIAKQCTLGKNIFAKPHLQSAKMCVCSITNQVSGFLQETGCYGNTILCAQAAEGLQTKHIIKDGQTNGKTTNILAILIKKANALCQFAKDATIELHVFIIQNYGTRNILIRAD